MGWKWGWNGGGGEFKGKTFNKIWVFNDNILKVNNYKSV